MTSHLKKPVNEVSKHSLQKGLCFVVRIEGVFLIKTLANIFCFLELNCKAVFN